MLSNVCSHVLRRKVVGNYATRGLRPVFADNPLHRTAVRQPEEHRGKTHWVTRAPVNHLHFICAHLGSSELIWAHRGSSGLHVSASGLIWANLGSSGPILAHLGASGLVHINLRGNPHPLLESPHYLRGNPHPGLGNQRILRGNLDPRLGNQRILRGNLTPGLGNQRFLRGINPPPPVKPCKTRQN